MISLAVDSNYDIYMDPLRNIGVVQDKAAVKQDCLLASQLLSGENPFNTDEGVTYMESLFQNKNPYDFEESMRTALSNVPHVTEITDFRVLQLSDVLEYQATIQSDYGEVTL